MGRGMIQAFHDLAASAAHRWPERTALVYKTERLSYSDLWCKIERAAAGLSRNGIARGDRIGIWLDKRIETIIAFFGSTLAGGVFVPVNPVLRSQQVVHILKDCNVRVLITTEDRLRSLDDALRHCRDLTTVVLLDAAPDVLGHWSTIAWPELLGTEPLGAVIGAGR